MEVKQRVPNFIGGRKTKVNQFETLEELLNIEWINFFSQQHAFFKFSIARDCKKNKDLPLHLLIAEFDLPF